MARNYRDYKISLTAGVERVFDVKGDYWEVVKSSSDVTLNFNNGSSSVTRRGGAGGPHEYDRVTIKSETDQSIVVALGLIGGVAPYNNSAASTGGGGGGGSSETGTGIRTPAPVTVASGERVALLPAASDRVEAIITVPATAEGNMRLGNSSVTPTTGVPIFGGDMINFPTKAAIYVYNDGPAAVTFNIMESVA